MAAGGPVKDLCEEASCSICLDYFKDPVTIAECGHNFCRACLTRSWGEAVAEASCPVCKQTAWPRNLRPNRQLANVVEIAKKFHGECGAERKGVEGKGRVCEKHQEPLKLFCKDDKAPICVVCDRSKEHRDHQGLWCLIITAAGQARVCEKHQKPLKLFCREDEAPICVDCDGSKEHRFHEVVPLEEAAQEYQGNICSFLEVLKKERTKILAFKSDVVKESQDLLKQTKGDKQRTVSEFRQLRQFLEIQEKHLLAHVEEMEKEIARERDEHLARLSRELSSLESLIQEVKEKIQQPPSELLQDVRTTLQRPASQLIRLLSSPDFFPTANVTFDLNTAHPVLTLSADRKSIRVTEKPQDLPNNPERFNVFVSVLGCEGFTTGRYFWEIIVGREEEWAVGIARKSVRRKGEMNFGPEGGIWAVGKVADGYVAFLHPERLRLALNGELRRIRVALNCDGGQVAFFNADTTALLYTFSGASFSGETLQPFFRVREKGHLRLPL
ncbi:PREDICTED: tripartite motif-containing protein 7-like [Gekko japonicus]|uniref:Tripartite motif-containing protein 7-like n=1 Tax=Gekko japonicus TaxID=146911 RepID=A0ABM1KBG6_GEKJA|nr:PREDICTED: tripartite motif-containing protein 7-like [Gekko japonicus]